MRQKQLCRGTGGEWGLKYVSGLSPSQNCHVNVVSLKNLLWVIFKDVFHSNSLPYLQCPIRVAAAGGCLIADLFRDRRLMGTVAGPEVCLYSWSCFLCSCDILTTSEVSQLFQGINNGSGSPYLTFTVQSVCFVVVVFYLPGYLGKPSDAFLLSWLRCPPSLPAAVHMGRHSHLHLCWSEQSLHPLHLWMHCRLEAGSPSSCQGVPRGSPSNVFASLVLKLFAQM